MSGDVVEIIVLRKSSEKRDDSEARYFVYPHKAAEFAIVLKGTELQDEERETLEGTFKGLLQRLGF